MPYFLAPEALTAGAEITLAGAEGAHLLGARRVRAGERFALQDPEGNRFQAELLGGERGRARVRVLAPLPVAPLPAVSLTLLQAAVKDRAAEWIVQKATELGVAAITFFPAANSTVSRRRFSAPGTLERWRRIAWEACKQCDRQFPPLLVTEAGLAQALAQTESQQGGAVGWLLEPAGVVTPAQAPRPDPPQMGARLLVGPEGGLTPQESRQAQAAGLTAVRLGAQLLRAETAALAGCALLLFGGE